MSQWSRRGVVGSLGAAAVILGCEPKKGISAPPAAGVCDFEGATPSAITGPFLPSDFSGDASRGPILPVPETDFDLTQVAGGSGVPVGQVVVIRGTVLGPECRPVVGADLWLWQADSAGQYNHIGDIGRVSADKLDPAFGYWGRATSDSGGRFTLKTIVPGAYPASTGWWRPPHLHWSIRAAGRAPVTTQSFFDGDVLDGVAEIRDLNGRDHILNMQQGFEGRLRGEALSVARRRLKDEMTARFSVQDGVPIGELVFRVV
jgi:protocatechuate 3,4-dioxygenase beta subunit